MKIGVAQRDLTPPPGLDLTGFFVREQPSAGIRDPLFGKALYLEQDGRKLLWIQADLLGLARPFVRDFRDWAGRELGLGSHEVMLSATHTHAGPASMLLLGCGRMDAAYMRHLRSRFEELSREATASTQPCRFLSGTGFLDLAVDRRSRPTALTDPRVAVLGWCAPDNRFLAAAAVYSMHPVALGATRLISADWPGRAASTLAALLPGNPLALVSSGACGNLNPPRGGAPESDMCLWADRVAATAARPLREGKARPEPVEFRTGTRRVDLPLEAGSAEDIERRVAALGVGHEGDRPQDQRFRDILATWRQNRLTELTRPGHDRIEAEILAIRLGTLVLVGINAEVFCHFTARIREQTGRDVHTLGCSNGSFGYLPHAAAYDEGGYEPGSSFLYYDSFPVKRGGLEMVADEAADLVEELFGREG